MILRYQVLHLGDFVAHLESEDEQIFGVPRTWLPEDVSKGTVLLVAPEQVAGQGLARFFVAEKVAVLS